MIPITPWQNKQKTDIFHYMQKKKLEAWRTEGNQTVSARIMFDVLEP